jgi:hypothetical protein
MKNALFILHFQPLEGYPPILNLLDYFSLENKFKQIVCYTTKGQLKHIYTNHKLAIKRKGNFNGSKLMIWLTYFTFNFSSILSLIIKRPSNVIYYETISSFPAYFYKTYINKKANIYIHYHEYSTKKEYSSNRINKFYHSLEVKLYPKVKWISHTNEVRLHKFLVDNEIKYNKEMHKSLPNYPSENWGVKNEKWDSISPIKIVFVGYSVDPTSCFIKEVIEWLAVQKISSILDIYCIKQNSLPKNLIGKKGNTTINLMKPVAYQELPTIISNYHVGLILYRGLTQNYIYNAPNKLFEYLACGLDVWFPKEMEGIKEFKTEKSPKVIEIDFNNLTCFNLEKMIAFIENKRTVAYYAEDVYKNLIESIK